jgi:hypothetical protein
MNTTEYITDVTLENGYGAVVQTFDSESVKTQIRWARGDRVVQTETL